jgi:hypothetical protein
MKNNHVPDEYCGKVKIELIVSCEIEVTPTHSLDDILSSFSHDLAEMGLNVDDIITEYDDSIQPTKQEGK